ncbi:MAG: pyrroloquinoline quinone biosynthesis peptide chaperone PqqD [Proteobacteria bacterium]|nr:MAG: pyrroloquinoline quinone biosynthesis peptide chaperone PqqD [Pseudomonadota bacterium]
MSKDRGRRTTVSGSKKRRAGTSLAGALCLAPGVRLERGDRRDTPVLLCPEGQVHLNRGAAAIIRLCDGSRRRDDIVAEIVRRAHGRLLETDVGEFLDAARSRGWIVEVPSI